MANDTKRRSGGPHPALRSLDRLVGTWVTLGPAQPGATDGTTTISWMEGGYFLKQEIDFSEAKGIEIIGYDEWTRSLRSQDFSNSGDILEYTYDLSACCETARSLAGRPAPVGRLPHPWAPDLPLAAQG